MNNLQDARVLIVGGARDLGLAIAHSVAQAGGIPLVGARDLDRATGAAQSIPAAEPVLVDITDERSIIAAVERVGQIDHVVITTSAHHNVEIKDLDHDATVAAFEAKIIGPLLLIKHLSGRIREGGSVVLFSGYAAWHPDPPYAIMGITNGAVSFAASHLAKELAPVRVNAISPGIIDSGSWDGLGDEAKQSLLEGAAQATMVGRHGKNSDIADAVIWLLTAGYVTGETIHVDGGAKLS